MNPSFTNLLLVEDDPLDPHNQAITAFKSPKKFDNCGVSDLWVG
jgi:hypothetical protein